MISRPRDRIIQLRQTTSTGAMRSPPAIFGPPACQTHNMACLIPTRNEIQQSSSIGKIKGMGSSRCVQSSMLSSVQATPIFGMTYMLTAETGWHLLARDHRNILALLLKKIWLTSALHLVSWDSNLCEGDCMVQYWSRGSLVWSASLMMCAYDLICARTDMNGIVHWRFGTVQ